MEVAPRPPKRKASSQAPSSNPTRQAHARGPKRNKVQTARTVLTQASDAALSSDGALDLQAFLRARDFEIKALEQGMQRARGALTTRAFQQVPRDMRRRTASHNVKRVPRRLRPRARREMKEDNTPVVDARRRRPGGTRARLRALTAKRLGLLAEKKVGAKAEARVRAGGIVAREPVPKARMGRLDAPPRPKSKFRKRQIHKTWLPTHLWLAKRARMTEPKNPLWRFAMPLTCTEKSYRPTHRAGGARGAVAWDTSYMSTIGLEGSEIALEKVLRGIGVAGDSLWAKAGQKWRDGKRSWKGWLTRDDQGSKRTVGPGVIFWCSPKTEESLGKPQTATLENTTVQGPKDDAEKAVKPKKTKVPKRQIMIRVHPAGFLELWTELLRLSKMQRPVVHVEDLRFQLGSIEITGPASTETLLGILHPFDEIDAHAETFKALAGVTNAASLPRDALLTFSILDPRLRYPPTKVSLPSLQDEAAASSLLARLSDWPVDQKTPSPSFFDRMVRYRATKLPSQKSLNRRKSLAAPGAYPALTPADPPIPVTLLTTRSTGTSSAQGTYTLIAPWKCILPIWYGLVHYPLSSGGNPRFGGLQEIRQIHFEHGVPWFPADYLGTNAGWEWEVMERERRKKEWEARPKGKRTAFESLDLGFNRKGEIGMGWACDFARLVNPTTNPSEKDNENKEQPASREEDNGAPPVAVQYLPKEEFLSALSDPTTDISPTAVVTVRISLLSRGMPQTCARIYRLPQQSSDSSEHSEQPPSSAPITQRPITTTPDSTNETTWPPTNIANITNGTKANTEPLSLRQQWLALDQSIASGPKKSKSNNHVKRSSTRLPPTATAAERRRALARELLRAPPLPYPATATKTGATTTQKHPPVPGEDDLIGFVTTGNFSLAAGHGVAVGSILAQRVRGGGVGRRARLCVVRNAGESVGRLAIWEVV